VDNLQYEPGQPRDDSFRGYLVLAGLGIAGTLAAAVLGNMGLFSGVLPGEPSRTGNGPTPQATVTVNSTTTQTVTVTPDSSTTAPDISATNAPTADTAPPTTASPSELSLGGTWHQGTLTIKNDHSIDLDAPPSDSQWAVLNLPPGSKHDLGISYENRLGPNSDTQHVLIDTPSYTACLSGTGYSADRIDLSVAKVGTTYCWTTSEGRYAVVRFLGPGRDGGWTFSVSTFKKADD
jgi:hypothetical protein